MNSTLVIALLNGGMLVLGILIASRMRLASLAALFRLQALLLAGYALEVAIAYREWQLIAIAVSILLVKVFLIPRFIVRVSHEAGAAQRLEAYLKPTTMLFGAMGVSALALLAVHFLFPAAIATFAVMTAWSLIAIGLFMLISRKGMFGQAFGFLVMENGVFTFGLALSGGMPFFVEIGILFDVLVLFILVAVLIRRAQEENRSVTTDYLRELVD